MKPMQPVRGTADLMPRQKSQMNFIVEKAIMIAGRYGFRSIETPIFEFTEVFSRPLGESSDVVAKETYSFEDRGGTSLTLRPEGTASVMRALISNGLTQTLPQKFFYSGPMFRYERPQKGRMRQFHQIGCEFIGTFEPLADAEVISCATHLLSELGILNKCKLYLNSLGDAESRDKYRSVLIGYLKDYSASLSKDSQRRLALNPLRILDSKAKEDKEIIKNAPKLNEFLTINSKEHFNRVTDALEKSAINWQLDTNLVRGLDYYSHTAFEFVTDALGSQGTVIGGGRYDGLSSMLGGPNIGAVGFAAGVERLMILTEKTEEFKYDVAVIIADDEASKDAFALAQKLRSVGLKVDIPFASQLSKRLKRANSLGCSLSMIIGKDEINSNTLQIKFMESGEQKKIAKSEAIAFVERLLRSYKKDIQLNES